MKGIEVLKQEYLDYVRECLDDELDFYKRNTEGTRDCYDSEHGDDCELALSNEYDDFEARVYDILNTAYDRGISEKECNNLCNEYLGCDYNVDNDFF